MSFIFTLSNIVVPLVVLSFKTLIRVRKNDELGAGQWFCFIIYTFISNFLFYLMYESNIYLFVDLAIKLGIVFMPASINNSIEIKISYLHLEILIDLIRSNLIQKFYVVHSYITGVALQKMDPNQQKQFREALIKQLSEQKNDEKQTQTPFAQKLLSNIQRFDNIGVTCDLITPEMLRREQDERKQLKKILSDQNLRRAATTINSEKCVKSPTIELLPSEPEPGSLFKKKGSYLIQKSSTDLGLEDDDDNDLTKKKSKTLITQNKLKKGTGQKENHYIDKKKQEPKMKETFAQKMAKQEEAPSMILRKLDESNLSEMFEDENEQEMISKVEAIIEIGVAGNIRLQIYNIELYMGDEIRIISLYGKEFERHKLISMQPQKHGYYELSLEGGAISKRRVKFRGNYDRFSKYISKATPA